ncbi:hypothetical protein BGZ54_008818 [Gamsiella multidivaricata]|nr:hypothetical protein BGZ54_008818 [Gamsiella multidivaricata]
MSQSLVGRQIDAIYHTSVVVFGREFYYGQGIMSAIPGTTLHGQPMEQVNMGETEIPQEVFMEFMDEMRETYTAGAYHLLDNNCNNFTNDVCKFLVGKPIPSNITSLPADFLNTPFGQMMRPMIENMFGPSRHVPSVPFITDLSQLQSIVRQNAATVVYFTSATCPPCRIIAPVFDEIVLSKDKEIKGVKVDVGVAQAIGREYGIQSTPTFVFFLFGKESSRFSGADQAELRSCIDVLIYSTHPAHPHKRLDLVFYKSLPTIPALFQPPESADAVDAVFTKLKTFLPQENSLSEADMKQLDKIHLWLKKRITAKTDKSAEPTMVELGANWKPILAKIAGLLPYEKQFPLLDILRMLILHHRVAEVYAKDGNQTLIKMFNAVADNGYGASKPATLMTLRIACNSFSSPLLSTYILSSVARESTKQLLVNTLLSDVDQHRQTASSLAFNIGLKIGESRAKPLDTLTPSLSGDPLESLEADWNMECLSAIAEAINKEDSEEILYRLVASVAQFIHMEESYVGAHLMNALDLPKTLETKIQNKLVKRPEVTGLCREVQEMIRTAAAEYK